MREREREKEIFKEERRMAVGLVGGGKIQRKGEEKGKERKRKRLNINILIL